MNKKIKFTLISYVLVLFIGTVISCDNGCGPFSSELAVTSFRHIIIKADFNDQNQLLVDAITDNSVKYNNYAVQISARTRGIVTKATNRSYSFINSAYACDPAPAKIIDKISNIEIIPNIDFNSDCLVGNNCVDLFDVIYRNEDSSLLKRTPLSDFVALHPIIPTEMTLMLKQAPSSSQSFIFTVKFTIDGIDLDTFEFETNSVNILL